MMMKVNSNRCVKRFCQRTICLAVVVLLAGGTASAQSSSLYQVKNQLGQNVPLDMRRASIIHTEVAEARSLQRHDIVMVRVDEVARMSSDGKAERRKTSNLNAILKDWVRLNGFRKLEKDKQSDGDPQIQGDFQQTDRAEGKLKTTERVTLNIASEIVDIKPNGNLVILGHKEVRINNEVWRVSITGTCRQQDIGQTNSISSDRIINLRLKKSEKGNTRDSYRRGWFKKAFDRITPF